MAKPLRIVLIVFLAIILLLVVLGFAANTQWARSQVENRLSEQFDGREVTIADHGIRFGFPLRIRAQDVRIANAPWAEPENMLELDSVEARLRVLPLLGGNVDLASLDLERPVLNLARQADGTANWETVTDDEESESEFRLGALDVRDGRLSYTDEILDADLTLDFATSSSREGEHALRAEGSGRLLGEAFTLDLQGAPPGDALDDDAPYEISLRSQVGEARIDFVGHAIDLANFAELHGDLELELPASTDLAARLGQPGLSIPAVSLAARLAHADDRWALENVELEAGNSRLGGDLSMVQGETPRFDISLRGQELNLDDWSLAAWLDRRVELAEEIQKEVTEEPAPAEQGYAEYVAPLQEFNGQVQVVLERLVFSGHTFDGLTLRADLDDEALRLHQLHLSDGEGSLAVTGALGLDADDPQADLAANFDQLELGNLGSFIELEDLGVLDGQLHSRFDGSLLLLEQTRLAYRNPQQALELEVGAEPRELDDGRRGVQLDGRGSRNDQAFEFDLALGPLLDLDSEDPYPVAGSFTSGDTRLTIDGSIAQPLDLGPINLALRLQGATPSELNALLDMELPRTPEYRVEGQVSLEDQVFTVRELDAQAGNSDLQGELRFDFAGRPALYLDARSRQLDLDDLFYVLEENTDLDEQAEEVADRERLFPAEPLDLAVLRDMDAEVGYRAERLISNQIPLENVRLEAELSDGILRLRPVEAGLGEGSLTANLRLDAREPLLRGDLDLRMQNVSLGVLLREADLDQAAGAASGIMGGDSQLQFRGRSVQELMASLDGALELVISGGHLDSLIVEILGLHVGEALVTAITDSEDLALRCAYARLDARSGVVGMEQFLISTEESNLTADGTIDLNTEQLEIALESHADGISIFSVDSPIELQGPLTDISVNVLTGGVLARGAASVVGALIAPPLAVLPWIEGLGADQSPGCREVIEGLEAKTEAPPRRPAGA